MAAFGGLYQLSRRAPTLAGGSRPRFDSVVASPCPALARAFTYNFFLESGRPLLCVLAGRTAPGGSVRVESFAGGVRTSPAGWGAPCFRCVGLCGRAHIGGGVAPQVRERRNAGTAFAFLGAVRILCPPAPQNLKDFGTLAKHLKSRSPYAYAVLMPPG